MLKSVLISIIRDHRIFKLRFLLVGLVLKWLLHVNMNDYHLYWYNHLQDDTYAAKGRISLNHAFSLRVKRIDGFTAREKF